jgi:hypothetical protein
MSGIKLLRPSAKKISLSEILTLKEAQALLKVYKLHTLRKKAQLGEIPCRWMNNADDPRSRRGLYFIESELVEWLGLNKERKTA